jgi:hypothetical protein
VNQQEGAAGALLGRRRCVKISESSNVGHDSL